MAQANQCQHLELGWGYFYLTWLMKKGRYPKGKMLSSCRDKYGRMDAWEEKKYISIMPWRNQHG